MVGSARPESGDSEGRHLLLYDGVCGLCSHLVQFVLAHDRRRVFHFASLQSRAGRAAVARSGGDPEALTTLYVIEDYRGAEALALRKARGAVFIFKALGFPWRLAGILGLLPRAWLDAAYDLVARHRYRMFGRRDSCLMPDPDNASRFLDDRP
jgi:predicted DCC family thiol-disulfide oxidoreductase YuxK